MERATDLIAQPDNGLEPEAVKQRAVFLANIATGWFSAEPTGEREVRHGSIRPAPCQCLTPGGHQITPPARNSSTGPPSCIRNRPQQR
ncbi:hypothetical protein [Dactylosporangium siamense]|uniref:Uncharacterized protein n=1 Tax=Dactylosporangium siamense TaxID=685454 RepID=A0A919PTK8_9ACTN|nr:hypothetical protein Dsi01nite_080130 [Dactylosporangium siamense]